MIKRARAVTHPRARLAVARIVTVFAIYVSLLACFAPESQRLSCSDVQHAGSFNFAQIEALVRDDDKGCQGRFCHGPQGQQAGLRLDTADLIFEELSTRPDTFYGILASGEMPQDGTAWTEEDLKVFRSWYCGGAFR